MTVALATFFSTESFAQVDFTVENKSGYKLYGIMVMQDGYGYSADLLTEDVFPSGTQTIVTIPEGYTCNITFKVTYKVKGKLYEEVLSRANVCDHSGMNILKNPNGYAKPWMTTQYKD